MPDSDSKDFKFSIDKSEFEDQKRSNNKDASESGTPSLEIDTAPALKRGRSELYREEERKREQEQNVPIDNLKRLFSNLIDGVMIIVVFVFAKLTAPYAQELVIENARRLRFNIAFSPTEITDICLVILFIAFFLLIYAYPCFLLGRSLGKNIIKIKIAGLNDQIPLSKKQILGREIIMKPISLFSLVGVLMIFTNEEKRGCMILFAVPFYFWTTNF